MESSPEARAKSRNCTAETGELAAVALKGGELLPFPHLFLFLGAKPATKWLDDVVARDEEGFILTGAKQTPPTCSRLTFPACSRLATAAPHRRNDAPLQSAKGRWPCSSCTPIQYRG